MEQGGDAVGPLYTWSLHCGATPTRVLRVDSSADNGGKMAEWSMVSASPSA